MWMECAITLRSSVLPVYGSLVCGVWHRTQSRTSRRSPPWPESGLWQPFHVAVSTTSRCTVTALPAGTKLSTAFAT